MRVGRKSLLQYATRPTVTRTPFARLVLASAGLAHCACSASPGDVSAGATSASARHPVVYDVDDRVEVFAASDDDARRLANTSVVALVHRSSLDGGLDASVLAPRLGAKEHLCAGERFEEQPAPAFCSGVLLDRDLVLTAGHCARAYHEEDIRVLFGYAYRAEEELALGPDDVYEVAEVVAESFGSSPPGRADYAWLRLATDALPRHHPSPWLADPAPLFDGEPLTVIGSANGTPLKIDKGGEVVDARSTSRDYFRASSDTTEGSSGAPAFTASLAVAGILARGEPDFYEAESGCMRTRTGIDPAAAGEEFTYAHRAVEGLCAELDDRSPLCFAECDEKCEPAPVAEGAAGGEPSCTFALAGARRGGTALLAAALLAAIALVRSRR